MNGLQTYGVCWLVCFVYSVGICFAYAVHGDSTFSAKYTYKQHLAGATKYAALTSLFLLGVAFQYYGTDKAKWGWSLRMPG